MTAATTAAREINITRIFDAPRELVFDAFTQARHIARWWGPSGFTNTVRAWDAVPGGAIDLTMHAPQGGMSHPMTGTFREIVKPERIVFVAIARDNDGNALLEALTTITLSERDGRTTLHLHARATGLAPIAEQMIGGMQEGWSQSLEKLGELVAQIA
jgi:uncharacterized protein YndB with AHSA1/START domain